MGSIENVFGTAFGSVEQGFELVLGTIQALVNEGLGSLGNITE